MIRAFDFNYFSKNFKYMKYKLSVFLIGTFGSFKF